MARRSICLLFFLGLLPAPLRAARLELRHAGSEATEISALVGEEIEVELWIDSEGQPLSGAAVFLSFDEDLFELVGPASGTRPFAPGSFFADGEVFRNEALAPDDPAADAAGTQIDYSVVRALDQGSGTIATFRLRARAPSAGSRIRIDESGIRETRFFTPDGRHQAFRFITPMEIRVRGIEISGLPSRLVLARGQVDSTSFSLDDFIFDPLHAAGEITWKVSSSTALELDLDPSTRRLRIGAPTDASFWEQLTLSATNPEGQSASARLDVFVDAAPVLPRSLEPIALLEDEEFVLGLDELAEDPDTPAAQLRWRIQTPAELSALIEGPPFQARLKAQPDWNGRTQITLIASDEFDFSDTLQVEVAVEPVNDAPRFLAAPNIRLTRGKQDSSLILAELVRDPEEPPRSLRLSWSGAIHLEIQRRNGRLVLSAPLDWEGSEEIRLRVEDSGGLRDAAVLTVKVESSLPPALINPPARRGLVAGESFVLDLGELALDPDDRSEALRWTIEGQRALRVQLSGNRAARIEAPPSFSGVETLEFSVFDPSGESASFELLVFAAAAEGGPALAPLPRITVPLDGVDASLDLDQYLFDPDHPGAQMEWLLPARDDVLLHVDPDTRVLTVTPRPGALPGEIEVELRVRNPEGKEAVQILKILLVGTGAPPLEAPAPTPPPEVLEPPPAAPTLASLPDLSLEAGAFDQSLDLDDFVGGDAQSIAWEVMAPEHVEVLVDPATHRLLVVAGEDWSGTEVVLLSGTDALGHVLQGVLRVEVLPPAPVLSLAELTQAALFAGDGELRLEVERVLDAEVDPLSLAWEARAARPLSVRYDAATRTLILRAETPWQSSEVITLIARDAAGHEASGRVFAQVHPTDGSVGAVSPEFRLRVVPNVLQPEFLDLFILGDLPLPRPPRLRLQEGTGSELPLVEVAPGIWHARHVLRPAQEGRIAFLALSLDEAQQAHKAELRLNVSPASRSPAPARVTGIDPAQ